MYLLYFSKTSPLLLGIYILYSCSQIFFHEIFSLNIFHKVEVNMIPLLGWSPAYEEVEKNYQHN